MSLTSPSADPLVRSPADGVEPAWFDRFYTNLHLGSEGPLVLIGAGVYPAERLVDGYAVAVTKSEQINARFSGTVTGARLPSEVGPLSWETVEPLRQWRVRLADNPSGIACDLLWTARTPVWGCDLVTLDDGHGAVSSFDHAFQSGYHRGWVEIDGSRMVVEGWTGQRDRSRGRRPATARQGLHLWVQAQFTHESIAFMLDLDRAGQATLLDGAVLGTDGTLDRIVAVDHDLTFDEHLEAGPGRLGLRTSGGRHLMLAVDPTVNRGGFLAGAGYGGFHGRPHGPAHLEHDRWDLSDPDKVPRALSYPLADRLSAFTRVEPGNDEAGAGVFEFAHTRSPAYRYRPGRAAR
ncbi:hypothetical protein [Pseudonocardia spinosispora]|uniref:hypothetical protein n=1 Tax=Pseudonocardia spinosispora TaxID=103441 RepID=UPI000420C2D0|nr:hypothetical protein [Pseudonocardia spinosispora]